MESFGERYSILPIKMNLSFFLAFLTKKNSRNKITKIGYLERGRVGMVFVLDVVSIRQAMR